MKNCSKCKVEKPSTEYYIRSASNDGLGSWCKACTSVAGAERYLRIKNGIVRVKPPPLTEAVKYDRWIARQEAAAGRPRPGLCEVCGGGNSGKRLHWDHNHVTGAFRGWLCNGCNVALGMIKDRPEILRALADYLESSP